MTFLFFYYYIPSPETFNRSELDDKKIRTGEITSPITETDQKIEFTFRDEKTRQKILVLYFKHDDLKLEKNPALIYGATCTIHEPLSPLEGARNPHQFDYPLFLKKKGIDGQIILSSIDHLTCFANPSIKQHIYTLRTNLLDVTTDRLHEDTAAWLHALVLGDDSMIDRDIIELFQRWGLSHILAISGLHVGIIVALLYVLLVRYSIATKEKAQIFMIVFLPIYAILAGGQPSVWRASLMIVLVLLLHRMRLRYSYTDIVSVIFIVLIIFDPYIVYHVGFQLSFAVTFGLILSATWISMSPSHLEKAVQISFVSQMMILPLQLHYFSTFQPLSILLNVVIVPYFSLFVIPAMFCLLIVIKMPLVLITCFETLFLPVHNFVLSTIKWVDRYADYPIIVGDFPLAITVVYYAVFIGMMIQLEKKDKRQSFLFGLYLTGILIFLTIKPYFSPIGTVTMLDVGQGDAFIIELPYRKGVFFIDAGASFNFYDFTASDKVYKQVIKPYLLGQGIYKIDAIFISHDDLDHHGSIDFMVKELKIDEIILGEFHELDMETYKEWQAHDIKVSRVTFNEQFMRASQAFHVLSPKDDKHDDNENSLVLYTELGGLSWLFTGDMGKATERDIVKNFGYFSVDVLKVGHHGSNTSTDPFFIEQINPKFALISAGVNNSYGHPTNEVLETLHDNGITIYRTDLQGAVQFQFYEKEGRFQSFIQEK